MKTTLMLGIAAFVIALGALAACESVQPTARAAEPAGAGGKDKKEYKVAKTEAEWKAQLSAEQFRILRQRGTERAFTGKYWNNHEKGVYRCAGCQQELFSSSEKFDSGTGWPSYFKPIADGRVDEHEDREYGMVRTEVVCSRCGGHLGHVFDDGPAPTGLRYCINSASLEFVSNEKSK